MTVIVRRVEPIEGEVVDAEVVLETALVPPPQALDDDIPAVVRDELAGLVDAMHRYAAAAQAANTIKAYSSDWRDFEAWCERYRLVALPASSGVAALYLTSLAERGLKLSTVRRRAAAITRAHRVAGAASPIWDARVMTLLEGLSRTIGRAPGKKVALLRDQLTTVVDRIELDTAAGLRDRALLLVGFALGLRRSELVALDGEDLSPSPDGIVVRIAKSKTDQAGHGAELLLAYAEDGHPCPVRSLRAWREHAAITTGPIFRRVTRTGVPTTRLTDKSVALIVKKRVRAAGLDPAAFAGHSLRSGFATQAARDGHHAAQIADVTRHRDRRVLDGYIQAGRGAKHIARVL
jgi:site-specific recombinase XerD